MSTPDLASFGYKQELKRTLSASDLVIYGLIFMVPIAPFGIYGDVFSGSGGMPALVYGIGMVAMLFTALTYGHLSSEFPVSGSVYGYVTYGVGRTAGFFAGWAVLMDYLLIPTLLYVVAATSMNALVPVVPIWLWSLIFLAINTIVNVLGMETTKKVTMIALIAELICLAIVLVVGAWWVATSSQSEGFTLRPFYNPDTFSMPLVMSAVSVGVLSFLGFDGIATLSEEARDAQKGPRRAMLGSLLIVGVLFMAQTYIAGLISPDGAAFAKDPGNAFALVAQRAGGPALFLMCAFATAIAWGIFNALVAQTALTRILFAMSRDRIMPKAFARVHPRTATPYIAALAVAAVSLVLVLVFDTLGIAAIAKLVNFGALTSFAVLHLTVIWHFFIRKRTGKVWAHLIAPIIGFIIIAYVWISLDIDSLRLGAIWMIIGVIYFLVVTKVLRRNISLDI